MLQVLEMTLFRDFNYHGYKYLFANNVCFRRRVQHFVFSFFCFRPWASHFFFFSIIIARGRKQLIVKKYIFARGRRTFFLGSTPFRRGGSPAPLRFPCFGGGVLCLRHRAAVADGDGVVIPPR